jgi:uncharacterized protein (TIGR02145 family)
MKKLYIFLATVLFTTTVFAQSPGAMSYQVVVRDAANAVVSNHSIGMKISVLQGSAEGIAIYSETKKANTDTNGLVSTSIGSGSIYDNIDWANGPYFIKTEIDPTGGTSYNITGISQLLSVPYAMHAKTAESISGVLTENDPIYSASQAHNITESDITLLADLRNTHRTEFKIADGTNTTVSGSGTVADPYKINSRGIDQITYEALLARVVALEVADQVISIPTFENSNITIGTQVWAPRNAEITTYSDGTVIPQVTDPNEWANLTIGAWCYYNNDPAMEAIYGKLYNWYAIAGIFDAASLDQPGLRKQFAPSGWHMPSDAEWTTLTDFLGGETIAGSKMKEVGIINWLMPNTDATNSSGFTGLPGGGRDSNGVFVFISLNGNWWSATEANTTDSWSRYLEYNAAAAGRKGKVKTFGSSSRFLKN